MPGRQLVRGLRLGLGLEAEHRSLLGNGSVEAEVGGMEPDRDIGRNSADMADTLDVIEMRVREQDRLKLEALGLYRSGHPGSISAGIDRYAGSRGLTGRQVRVFAEPTTGEGSDLHRVSPSDPRRSNRKGAPATAPTARIRVPEGEALTHHAADVVDIYTLQVLSAEGVDEDPDTPNLENLVIIFGAVFDIQTILEPGASTGKHGHAQTRAALDPMLLDEVLHFYGRRTRHR